jgi:hypothetical protein
LRDSDLAVLEAGSDPFEKFTLCAPDCYWDTIQAGKWPDTTSFLEPNTEPLAPVRKQWQAVEVSNGTQNQIGRIAFDNDAGLVTFSTELRGGHHQMSYWAPPTGYRQRPTVHCGAFAKLDHIWFQILAADSDRLLCEDRRPESRDLNISAKRRKQVPV